jgi:hypothetical protein
MPSASPAGSREPYGNSAHRDPHPCSRTRPRAPWRSSAVCSCATTAGRRLSATTRLCGRPRRAQTSAPARARPAAAAAPATDRGSGQARDVWGWAVGAESRSWIGPSRGESPHKPRVACAEQAWHRTLASRPGARPPHRRTPGRDRRLPHRHRVEAFVAELEHHRLVYPFEIRVRSGSVEPAPKLNHLPLGLLVSPAPSHHRRYYRDLLRRRDPRGRLRLRLEVSGARVDRVLASGARHAA